MILVTGATGSTGSELVKLLASRKVLAEAMREALSSMNMPAWQADGLLEDYAHYGRGEAAMVATGVQDATGSPPRSFATFAHDYATALS